MSANEPTAAFVDTNVWLYALIENDEQHKHQSATELLTTCRPVVSIQVINEVCNNLLRKGGFAEEQIHDLIEAFYKRYSVVQLDRNLLLGASRLRQRHSVSFWDSLIIAAALESGVAILYSEDLQHGLVVERRLRIINPFVS